MSYGRLGVRLSELRPGVVLANMDDLVSGTDKKNIQLYKAFDTVNSRYQNGIIRASALNIPFRGGLNVISPARSEALFD